MSSSTVKYGIQYPVLADTVASLAATVQNLANRADLLLGESGSYTIASLAANTTHTQTITLARTYPGNVSATPPGIVLLNLPATIQAANPWTHWLDTWTGTATSITGFKINTQFSGTQTNRVIYWRFLPVL